MVREYASENGKGRIGTHLYMDRIKGETKEEVVPRTYKQGLFLKFNTLQQKQLSVA